MSTGYILDHTAVSALAQGNIYMAARVFRSVQQVQPLYVPAVSFAHGLTGSALGEVAHMLQDALAAPCFVFRPLDEASCWAIAQIAQERAADLPTAHAAHLALGSGLPVLTRQAAAYKKIDSRITAEVIS
ncbi:hypothetical protein ACFYWY_37785 [Streptomyces sp. NPDC002870]|uniref:hypothetical protein n=1 Tax=Streptomyces sp. NPDC002870 TaxID=3364666 RepID=UPI0036B21D9A